MEIKTKFNHGERVQAITFSRQEHKEKCEFCEGKGEITHKEEHIECPKCYGDGYKIKSHGEKWFVPTDSYFDFVIQRISVELYNPNNKKFSDNKSWIYYMSSSSGTMFDENNLFHTLEEAQKECDRRNNL